MILLAIWIKLVIKNEEWIRKQTRAEAKKEKVSERLRHLQAQLTDQYQISYTEALEKHVSWKISIWQSRS